MVNVLVPITCIHLHLMLIGQARGNKYFVREAFHGPSGIFLDGKT